MICPKCNSQVEEGLNFCTHCGADLKQENNQSMAYQPYNNPPPQQFNTNQNPNQYAQPNNPYTQNPDPYNQQQPMGYGSPYQQPPIGYPPTFTGPVRRTTGIVLIIVYEVIFGLFLMLMGGTLAMLNSSLLAQINTSVGASYTIGFFHMIGYMLLVIGLVGVIGAILFFQWRSIGYIITIIFLIITGILFFSLYFIPLISMIVSLVYFLRNKNFKNTFRYMKDQKRMKLNKNKGFY